MIKQPDSLSAVPVRELYHLACDEIAGFCLKASALLKEAEADALAYLNFSHAHRKRLCTNNVQVRASRRLERRSRVAQVFPSRRSPIRMLGAVFAEMDEGWASRHRFTEDSIVKAYGKNAGVPAGSCTGGDAKEHGKRIIELVVEDNPTGRKAA